MRGVSTFLLSLPHFHELLGASDVCWIAVVPSVSTQLFPVCLCVYIMLLVFDKDKDGIGMNNPNGHILIRSHLQSHIHS